MGIQSLQNHLPVSMKFGVAMHSGKKKKSTKFVCFSVICCHVSFQVNVLSGISIVSALCSYFLHIVTSCRK
jgi:hypothetical protein